MLHVESDLSHKNKCSYWNQCAGNYDNNNTSKIQLYHPAQIRWGCKKSLLPFKKKIKCLCKSHKWGWDSKCTLSCPRHSTDMYNLQVNFPVFLWVAGGPNTNSILNTLTMSWKWVFTTQPTLLSTPLWASLGGLRLQTVSAWESSEHILGQVNKVTLCLPHAYPQIGDTLKNKTHLKYNRYNTLTYTCARISMFVTHSCVNA